MQNWDDLRFVLALYRHKTMSRASDALGTNIATVSRRIERITANLDEALFVKTDNTWVPTAICQQLVNVARATEQQLLGVEANQEKAPEPGSILRLNCNLTLLQVVLSRNIESFLEENPNINLDFTFRRQSLAYAETDVAVGFVEPQEGRIMRRRVGAIKLKTYAARSKAYDIQGWLRLEYLDTQPQLDTPMVNALGCDARISVEGLNLARKVLHSGPWAALIPESAGQDDPNLTEVDLGVEPKTLDIWMSFHTSRRLDPVVRLAADFVESCFES